MKKRRTSNQQGLLEEYEKLCSKEGPYRPSVARHTPHVIASLEANPPARVKLSPAEAEALRRLGVKGLRRRHKRYEESVAFLFRQHYKRPLEDVVEAAKGGKNTELFRLIEWDKNYLFEDWVKERILQAQYRGDLAFFDCLALAINKLTGYRKKGRQHLVLRQIIRSYWNEGLFLPQDTRSFNHLRRLLEKPLMAGWNEAERSGKHRLAKAIRQDLDVVTNYHRFRKLLRQTALLQS